MNVGLQLYTVRDLFEQENHNAAAARLKELGLKRAQAFGDPDTARNLCEICREAGVEVMGMLTSIDACEERYEEILALAREFGMKDVGISSAVKTAGEAWDLIRRANAVAKKLRQEGISFSYHNHSNEFIRTENGKRVMDLMLEGFSADVDFMPDTYWLQYAGMDVRRFLEQTRGRVKILHLKDMKATPHPTFAPVGEGNLWFEGILQTARDCGVEELIAEQDKCEGDSADCARISLENIKNMVEKLQ